MAARAPRVPWRYGRRLYDGRTRWASLLATRWRPVSRRTMPAASPPLCHATLVSCLVLLAACDVLCESDARARAWGCVCVRDERAR